MFLDGMAVRLKKGKNRPTGPWGEALVNPS
jgi:hypothetical protein